MDAENQARQQRKRQLLQELAELHVEEMVQAGGFDQTPHFGTIERAASGLGSRLSREIQERASREVAADSPSEAPCPTCGASCEVTTKRRTVKSLDGPVELTEAVAECCRCRRSFFPSADGDGTR
ncbi:MAG: hypothetical protein JW719_12525 [Pirellulales bacterium]|nr:hypothetical protein [Pirellulales bacterium]